MREAAKAKADESTRTRAPAEFTTTGFGASGYVPGEAPTHCVGSVVKSSPRLTCCEDAKLCCAEKKQANDVGRRAGDDEKVGKGNPDRAK